MSYMLRSIIIGRTPECSAIDVRMNVTEIGRLSSSIGQVLINADTVNVKHYFTSTSTRLTRQVEKARHFEA